MSTSAQQWFRFAIVGHRRHALVEHDDGYGRMLCGFVGKVDLIGDKKLTGQMCEKCRAELRDIGTWAGQRKRKRTRKAMR